jgi:uncharacterized protein YdbL (DUF1318 family)
MTQNHTRLSRRALLGVVAAAGALALLPATGHAASLSQLIGSGSVGERWDGYTQSRDGSGQDVVNDVNAKRRSLYEQRAKETGTSVLDVGRIYAAELYQKASPGTWFLLENGSWVQK